jgi:YD repeat-containing protein
VTYKAGKLSQVESNKATDMPLVTRTYDAEGRLSSVTDAAGTVTTYAYLGSTNLVASVTQVMTGSPGKTFVTSYTYDNQGRQTKTSVGASSPLETMYAYTSLGHVEQVTDPAGRAQKMLHDALGRRVDHVRLGDGANFIRNGAAFVDSGLANSKTYLRQFDGLGSETRTHFDFAGRKFAIQYPGADLTTMPTASVPQPNTELFVYDGLSQIQQRFDGDGGETAMVYDGSGRLIVRYLAKVRKDIAVWNAADVLNRDVFGRILAAESYSGMNPGTAEGTPLLHGLSLRASTVYDSLSRVHEESLQTFVTGQTMKATSSYAGASRFRTGLGYKDGEELQDLELTFTPSTLQRLGTVSWQRPSVGATAVPAGQLQLARQHAAATHFELRWHLDAGDGGGELHVRPVRAHDADEGRGDADGRCVGREEQVRLHLQRGEQPAEGDVRQGGWQGWRSVHL